MTWKLHTCISRSINNILYNILHSKVYIYRYILQLSFCSDTCNFVKYPSFASCNGAQHYTNIHDHLVYMPKYMIQLYTNYAQALYNHCFFWFIYNGWDPNTTTLRHLLNFGYSNSDYFIFKFMHPKSQDLVCSIIIFNARHNKYFANN